jgi:hypothetical protein
MQIIVSHEVSDDPVLCVSGTVFCKNLKFRQAIKSGRDTWQYCRIFHTDIDGTYKKRVACINACEEARHEKND